MFVWKHIKTALNSIAAYGVCQIALAIFAKQLQQGIAERSNTKTTENEKTKNLGQRKPTIIKAR